METLVRPDSVSLATHIVVAALLAGVFTFLHRQSRIVYFSYWALAWGLLSAGLIFQRAFLGEGPQLFLLPYGLLELAFAASLIFAGASVSSRFELKLSSGALWIPVTGLAGYTAAVLAGSKSFFALHQTLLAATYGWNFLAVCRRGRSRFASGQKLFSASLLLAAAFSAHDALWYGSMYFGHPDSIPTYFHYRDLYDLLLDILLAFSAMMMWMEAQQEQLLQANEELAQSRQEIARHSRMDPLTGLLNRTALVESCERNEAFSGVVAVLDLDNFKDINDALGHLTGDEVLANVGNLIRSSVRKEDLAWRWGGDEFVILFHDQSTETVQERMRVLENRLQKFRLRGKGVLPVNLSWGTAELVSGPLRQAIDRADQQMYLRKREKASPSKFFAG